MDTQTIKDASWVSLSQELGTDYLGWFRHSNQDGDYYIDIYRFWLESFDEHIKLTPENLHYGIFHHCLDKEALEAGGGNLDITTLRTVSLYSDHAEPFTRVGKVDDAESRASERASIEREILSKPKYLHLLKETIQGRLEPSEAERISEGVLSARIL